MNRFNWVLIVRTKYLQRFIIKTKSIIWQKVKCVDIIQTSFLVVCTSEYDAHLHRSHEVHCNKDMKWNHQACGHMYETFSNFIEYFREKEFNEISHLRLHSVVTTAVETSI